MARILPVTALRAFEAAARHMSFKHAADELAVTPTAISHQIRLLEESLGCKLFDRKPRQVQLTPKGQELFPVLRNAFGAMALAVDSIRTPAQDRSLTLSATTGFAARWLIPRLARFNAENPDLVLKLHASDEPVDLHGGEADIAIRYGQAPFPGLVAEPLFEERFAPICSPHLAIRGYADMATVPLLRSEWRRSGKRVPTWPRWFAAADLPVPTIGATTIFTDDSHLAQATLAGQGIALLSPVLVAGELAGGALVQPFGPELPGDIYYLVHTGRAEREAEIRRVHSWLKTEVLRASL